MSGNGGAGPVLTVVELAGLKPAHGLTIDDIKVGDSAEAVVAFDIAADPGAACHASDSADARAAGRRSGRNESDPTVINGLAIAARFADLLATQLPGRHAVMQKFEFKFHRPVHVGVPLTYRCTVERVHKPLRVVALALSVSKNGEEFVTGHCQCQMI